MAKLKLTIDNDVDFVFSIEVEALGHSAKLDIGFKKVKTGTGRIEYTESDIIDLSTDEFEVIQNHPSLIDKSE